jgi:putative PEP-CTERM system histidine kinase
VLLFAASVALAAVVFSRTARARLRVTLIKHWFPYKYDYRNEWLDLTERLTRDSDGSSLAQRTVDAFVRLARVRGGCLFALRDDALQIVATSHFGLATGVNEPAASTFCRFLEEREWIVDIDQAREGRGRDAEVPLPQWLAEAVDAWLAVPLIHERRLHALVVLSRPLVRGSLTWEDLDLLRTAARQAASYFALEHSADALARERQFAALNRFTTFLMHDLSNIVAQQRLILENAARHKSNPAFVDDAIDTIENTVRRTTRLLDQLKSELTTTPPARRTELAAVCRDAVAAMSDRKPRPELRVVDSAAAALVAGERLQRVLEHVIRNAQDATPAERAVTVTVRVEGAHAVIDVTDSGCGMAAEFIRDRLFRPFDTTKGAKGMGIGAFQTREFVRMSGGQVKVTSTVGSGTSFVISLPLVS